MYIYINTRFPDVKLTMIDLLLKINEKVTDIYFNFKHMKLMLISLS